MLNTVEDDEEEEEKAAKNKHCVHKEEKRSLMSKTSKHRDL